MMDNKPINDFFSLIPIDKQHNDENGMIDHLFFAIEEYVFEDDDWTAQQTMEAIKRK